MNKYTLIFIKVSRIMFGLALLFSLTNNANAATINAGKCSFTTFTTITPTNVISILQSCGTKLLDDSNAALASAAASKDNIAIACLTPSVALVKAAIGTPATSTTPAQLAGPILIFQKFREFLNVGGITNCKAWVNNTVTAAAASGL